MPRFYILPKIQKEDNPEKPVISSIKVETKESDPKNAYQLSLDFKSLYTSIPDSERIKALKYSLEKSRMKI